MRRPRFTLRWLMVAVAIVAFGCGSVAWLNARSRRFRQVAADHRGGVIAFYEPFGDVGTDAIGYDSRRRRVSRRLSDWHAALASKYERAARHPWLPVEPDPPMPE